MYLTSYYPTRSLTTTLRDFDSLFDRVFGDALYSSSRHFTLDENDESYTLNLNLPGFKTEHVSVTLDKGILSVSAKRDQRSYNQSVIVPEDVDADKIEAKLEDGVLQLVLGKQAVTKPRQIEIK